jgi:hypothetical protein
VFIYIETAVYIDIDISLQHTVSLVQRVNHLLPV